MARSSYKCKIDLSFILDDQSTEIDSQFLKYLIIDNSYETRSMPVIYISLSLNNDIYTKLIENEKKAKIYFCLWKYNINSGSSIYKKDIEGQFTYIRPKADPNYTQDLVDTVNSDNSYRTVTIALISMDILNSLKTSFNGIFGEIDQNTLILKALNGLDAVVEPPIYNPVYDTISIPAKNNREKLLQYLFDKCPFYDTNYMFFVDFKKAYLFDMRGKYCDAKDGQLHTVMFDIREVTEESSYYEGMEIKNNAYYIHINPANTSISENKSTDKITNQMVFISNEGNIDYVDLNINNNEDATVKQSIIRGENAILYKNIMESNTIVIELSKENLDSNILTPNKEYILNNYENYADYNGNYTLLSKKEIIVNKQGEFVLSVGLALRKVGNISSIGLGVVQDAQRKSASSLHKYKQSTKTRSTTARQSNNNKDVKPVSSNNTKAIASTMSLRTSSVLPTVNRMRATSDISIKRTPNIMGEGE